jgi:hypothetical protein
MIQLLMEDGLLEGTRAIGPLDSCPLGGARLAVHPARSIPDASQPIYHSINFAPYPV